MPGSAKEVSGFGQEGPIASKKCPWPMPDSDPALRWGPESGIGPRHIGHRSAGPGRSQTPPGHDDDSGPAGNAGSESGIGRRRIGHQATGSGRSQTPPGHEAALQRCLASAKRRRSPASDAPGRCLTPAPTAMQDRSEASARDISAIKRWDPAEARHLRGMRLRSRGVWLRPKNADRQQAPPWPMPDSGPDGSAGSESGIGRRRIGHQSAGPGRSQTPRGHEAAQQRCLASAKRRRSPARNAPGRCLTPAPSGAQDRSQASARDISPIKRRNPAEARHLHPRAPTKKPPEGGSCRLASSAYLNRSLTRSVQLFELGECLSPPLRRDSSSSLSSLRWCSVSLMGVSSVMWQ